MRLSIAAAAAALICISAQASEPAPQPIAAAYTSITPQQMASILNSKETPARIVREGDQQVVRVEYPFGDLAIHFAICHERPNPCGYDVTMRYRGLGLTPDQLNRFNGERASAGYAYRPPASRDTVLILKVSVGGGVTAQYVRASIGDMFGLSEVFEGFVEDELKVPFERVGRARPNSHTE